MSIENEIFYSRLYIPLHPKSEVISLISPYIQMTWHSYSSKKGHMTAYPTNRTDQRERDVDASFLSLRDLQKNHTTRVGM